EIDPTRVSLANPCQHVAGENGQAAFIDVAQALDEEVFNQVRVEVPQIRCDTQISSGDDGVANLVQTGIDVELEGIFEKPSKGFKDAAFQVSIIFFLEEFAQGRHAHGDADHFFGVAEEVSRQAVKLRVIGN